MKTLIYPVMGCIQSCIPGALELQEGEQVTLLLDQEKNANFAESLLGTVTQIDVATGTDGWTRRYHIQYDEDELGVGITSIEMCDVLPVPRCFSCCEYLEELIGNIDNNRASPLVGSILNSENPLDIDFALLDEGDVTDLADVLACKIPVCNDTTILDGDGTDADPLTVNIRVTGAIEGSGELGDALDVRYATDVLKGAVTLAVPANYPANIDSETEAVTPAYLRDALGDLNLHDDGCGFALVDLTTAECTPKYVVWVDNNDTLEPGVGCLKLLSADSNVMASDSYGNGEPGETDLNAAPWTVDTLIGGADWGNDTAQGYAPEAHIGTLQFDNLCGGQNYRFEVVSGGQEPQASFYARGFGLVVNGVPRTFLVPTAMTPVGNYTGYQISLVGSYLIGTLPFGTVTIEVYWVEHPNNPSPAILQAGNAIVSFRIVRDI